MTDPLPRPPTGPVKTPSPPAEAVAPEPASGPDPRDVKDRRETGWIGIASAGLVAIAGAGLFVEGGTGGGLLLALIGLGAIVFAAVVVVVSWRFGHAV